MILTLPLSAQNQPAADAAQAPAPQFTPARSWYDVQQLPGRWEWQSPSLDGSPVRVRFYPSPKANAPLLIVLPDYPRAASDVHVQRIAGALRAELHVAVVTMRGHIDNGPDPFRSARGRAELHNDFEWAQRTILDYWAAIASIQENSAALRITYSHSCLLAGDFHSNLVLTQALPTIQCLIAVSPDPEFYRRQLAELAAAEIVIPTLIVESRVNAYRLRQLAGAMERARLLVSAKAGRGLRLLSEDEASLNEALRFVSAPETYLPAAP